MSGGHFDYQQYHIADIADSIEEYINGRELDNDEVDNYISNYWLEDEEKAYIRKHNRTIPNRYEYGRKTIAEFRKGVKLLKKAHVYAQRIDWLLSGDDGEDSFHERLKEDLEELKSKKRVLIISEE